MHFAVYGINGCNFFTAGNKGYAAYGYAIIRYVNRAGKKSIGVDFRGLLRCGIAYFKNDGRAGCRAGTA